MAVVEIRVGPPCRFHCRCGRGIRRKSRRNVRDRESSGRGSILQATASRKFHSFARYKTLYPRAHHRGQQCAPAVVAHWFHSRKNRFQKEVWLWVDSSCPGDNQRIPGSPAPGALVGRDRWARRHAGLELCDSCSLSEDQPTKNRTTLLKIRSTRREPD